MANFLIATLVVFLILGGPLSLYLLIGLLNKQFGGLKAKVVRYNNEGKLGILVSWDSKSFPIKLNRVRMDFTELFTGGRSHSVSYTFDDSSAKSKSFLIPLNLSDDAYAMLVDDGPKNVANPVKKASVFIEVETTENEAKRFKISKKSIQKLLEDKAYSPSDAIELLEEQEVDKWALLTKIYPWRVVEEEEEAVAGVAAEPGAPIVRAPVTFDVTKVWIEPGCIVCDACEIEAPEVFWVQDDTCIVRENAPLADGAAIKAAAEGCPVDVIKFTKVAKAS